MIKSINEIITKLNTLKNTAKKLCKTVKRKRRPKNNHVITSFPGENASIKSNSLNSKNKSLNKSNRNKINRNKTNKNKEIESVIPTSTNMNQPEESPEIIEPPESPTISESMTNETVPESITNESITNESLPENRINNSPTPASEIISDDETDESKR